MPHRGGGRCFCGTRPGGCRAGFPQFSCRLREFHRDEPGVAVALDSKQNMISIGVDGGVELLADVVGRCNRLLPDHRDHVAGTHTIACSGSSRVNCHNQCAVHFLGNAELASGVRGQRREFQPELALAGLAGAGNLRRIRLERAYTDIQFAPLAFAPDPDLDGVVCLGLCNQPGQIAGGLDLVAVKVEDHIAGFQFSLVGGAVGLDIDNQRTAVIFKPEARSNLLIQALNLYTEPAALDAAVCLEVGDDFGDLCRRVWQIRCRRCRRWESRSSC